MSEASNIVTELREIHSGDAWHGQSLSDALSGLSAEQAAARPIDGAHNIWEIVNHIAGWENIWRRRLEGDAGASEPEEGDFPVAKEASEPAWRAALAHLNDNHSSFLGAVAALTDDQLSTNVPHRDYSIRFLLRGAVRHHVYHAAQIALLRKAFAEREQVYQAGQ